MSLIDYNSKELLTGNSDAFTKVSHNLTPFTAKYVRVKPTLWNNDIVMRLELYYDNSNNTSINAI